jgi:hypothetical protein
MEEQAGLFVYVTFVACSTYLKYKDLAVPLKQRSVRREVERSRAVIENLGWVIGTTRIQVSDSGPARAVSQQS